MVVLLTKVVADTTRPTESDPAGKAESFIADRTLGKPRGTKRRSPGDGVADVVVLDSYKHLVLIYKPHGPTHRRYNQWSAARPMAMVTLPGRLHPGARHARLVEVDGVPVSRVMATHRGGLANGSYTTDRALFQFYGRAVRELPA